MALNVLEFYGYSPSDTSPQVRRLRSSHNCPFVKGKCVKKFRDGTPSGACTVKQATSSPVICCPQRMYADNYRILKDIADIAFGENIPLFPAHVAQRRAQRNPVIAVFGKKWGRELRLPSRGKHGRYFVDWILAYLDQGGHFKEFVAVEVQTIDTTGTYRPEVDHYYRNKSFVGYSTAGLNWENVSKRILPQIIYKGHVLRRERKCRKGLFFVCPSPVHERILVRLGNELLNYEPQPGALTFMWYDLGKEEKPGELRSLTFQGQQTTTVDQVALAFTSPSNLPPKGVYERAILEDIGVGRSNG